MRMLRSYGFIPIIAGKISQLMEQLDVFISIKPKPKQPSKVSGDNAPKSLNRTFAICQRFQTGGTNEANTEICWFE